MKILDTFFMILIALCLLSFDNVGAVDFWEVLGKVEEIKTYNKQITNYEYSYKVSKEVKALEGKIIQLKGYIIPADLTEGRMTLSKFSYSHSSCYYSPSAKIGDNVIIKSAKPIIYRMDKPVILQGKLKIDENSSTAFYTLEDAVCKECLEMSTINK